VKTKLHTLALLVGALALTACSTYQTPIVRDAVPKDHGLIGAGEGPAWHDGSLYFVDGERINRMDARGRTTAFRETPSNGLLFDRDGRLLACEHKARRVTRTEKDGSITVLADHFQGNRFNSPNDLCADSQGRIYFTDPRYGPRVGMEIRDEKGRIVEGVYRITEKAHAKSRVELLLGPDEVNRPNGILVTPDNHFLYVADNNNNNHDAARKLLRFTLNADGSVRPGSRRVIFDWRDSRGPDGLKMDGAGRLYVCAGRNEPNEYETTRFKAGCYVLSPGGRLIDFIATTPDEATNCALGGVDKRTLYITSGKHLWSLSLK
jgi:gluconolactonase